MQNPFDGPRDYRLDLTPGPSQRNAQVVLQALSDFSNMVITSNKPHEIKVKALAVTMLKMFEQGKESVKGTIAPYLLFCGDTYYPSGGWADFGGRFESIEKAKDALLLKSHDWAEVVDITTDQVVWKLEDK